VLECAVGVANAVAVDPTFPKVKILC